MDFSGRQVVVTGGTGALGSAVVAALVAAGAHCVVPVRDEAERQTSAYGDSRSVTLVEAPDLADAEAIERLYAAAPHLWASLHIAGGFAFGRLAEADVATLRIQVEMNLITCLLCCRAAVRSMTARGEGGRIVNVAARAGLEWRDGAQKTAYAAAKAGVAALTTALAEEVASEGILVNAVAPSILDTPANRRAMPRADHARWPKVEDVARTILFLASPENRVVRGAVTPVYGES